MVGTGVGEAVAAAGVAKELYDAAREQGWVARLTDVFRAKHRILVLGASGTGKTNLISSLSNPLPPPIDRLDRTEFSNDVPLRINKKLFVFVDTPGQIEHETKRRAAINRALKGDIEGVLNVVSYGYHEGKSSRAVALSGNRAKPSYLEANRGVEITLLNEWAPLLAGTAVRWIITAVSKADLWWPTQDSVLEHYRSGFYSDGLRDLHDLGHSVMPYCAVIHRFYGDVPLSGTFDDGERATLHRGLLRALVQSTMEAAP